MISRCRGLMHVVMILAMVSIMSFIGCATQPVSATISPPTSGAPTAQETAAQALMLTGDFIKAVPPTMDALYSAGKVTKEQYNQVAALYQKSVAAYRVAVDTMMTSMALGATTDSVGLLKTAMATLSTSSGDLRSLVQTFQGG